MINRTAIMQAAWARYRAHKLCTFSRSIFGASLAWAWHDAKKAAADAASDARMAEADRAHRAAWYAKPENREATVITGREALSRLPAHMSAARAADEIDERARRAEAAEIEAATVYTVPLPVWRSNPDLMQRLMVAQNHAANLSQNITTFAIYFDTRDELARHVERYERRAAEYRAPVRRRAYA